ncbi:MAG: ribosomal L7Ae/L30e/S12e/Gadd45 family protein [Clostridia bacterium]|nr:ribosomal L7Ae/L30e/S12e/Gadd45 family protein [Clostridia bacterium]
MRTENPGSVSHQKLLSALGLCRKAGKLICGTPMICDALRSAKKPYLVIMASDNSENTQKKLFDKCSFYGVELIRVELDGNSLSGAIGKSGRISAVAVTDENLCRMLRGAMKSET